MITNSVKPLIYDLDFASLEDILGSEPRYRAQQIWQGLYHQLWQKPEQFTNLPLSLRQKLGAHCAP